MPKKVSDMTVKELRAEATRLKIDGRSSLTTKEMLVKAVTKAKAKKAKSPAKKESKTTKPKAKSPAKKAKSPAKKAKSPAKKAKAPPRLSAKKRTTLVKRAAAKRAGVTTKKQLAGAMEIETALAKLPQLTFKRLADMKNGEKIVLAMSIEQGIYTNELEHQIMPIKTMMRAHKATFTKTGTEEGNIMGIVKSDGETYKAGFTEYRGLAVIGRGADTSIEWSKLGNQKVYWE